MKTLVVVNQKGGVGKTTVVVNLAHHLSRMGMETAVLDIDVQADSSFALEEYASKMTSSQFFLDAPKSVPKTGGGITVIGADDELLDIDSGTVELDDAAERFRSGIDRLEGEGFDLCLIDAPPAIGVRLYASLAAADYVLSPIEVETFSIKGINLLLRTIQTVVKLNPRLDFLGMIPNKVDRRNPRHLAGLKELREAYGKHILPVTIGLRTSISESAVAGKPIWTNTKTSARAAKREMQELADYVHGKIVRTR